MAITNGNFSGPTAAHRRQIYKGAGYLGEDFERPHIGIANAFSEATPVGLEQ